MTTRTLLDNQRHVVRGLQFVQSTIRHALRAGDLKKLVINRMGFVTGIAQQTPQRVMAHSGVLQESNWDSAFENVDARNVSLLPPVDQASGVLWFLGPVGDTLDFASSFSIAAHVE